VYDTTPPAAPDLQAELEATNRQVEILSDALAESRREVSRLKAAQEPVAWRVRVETKLRDGSVDVGYQLRNGKLSKYDEPLYTTPPAQKPWVGLTDKEFEEIIMSTTNATVPVLLWQLIQDKLKEKNT
jgi:hypothetical protein